jgi:plasmid stability protein
MLTKPDFTEICPPLPDDRSTPLAPVISMRAMAQLIVRDIDKALVDLLKRRAVANGRSAEAEHREILRTALQPRRAVSLKDHLLAMPAGGDDADFAIKRSTGRRVKL